MLTADQQNELVAYAKSKGLESFATGKVVRVSIVYNSPAVGEMPARTYTVTKVVRSKNHLDKLLREAAS